MCGLSLWFRLGDHNVLASTSELRAWEKFYTVERNDGFSWHVNPLDPLSIVTISDSEFMQAWKHHWDIQGSDILQVNNWTKENFVKLNDMRVRSGCGKFF
jgi:hypothetical protein